MSKNTQVDEWFASWFDTPYYHILYRDRDYDEARMFMEKLTASLNLKKGASVLDLACGRGRHSFFLNTLGYDVTGIDLSPSSIAYAQSTLREMTQESTNAIPNKLLEGLYPAQIKFDVHNMVMPYKQQFDAVFNLFTSFGYFEHENENLQTIKAIKENLKEDGCAVIDFMNVPKVIKNLIPLDTKIKQGITFLQKRYLENNHIYKEISFMDDGHKYHFTERVHALTLTQFTHYFNEAGLQLTACYGNYNLEPYDIENSDRLIMVLKK